MVVITWLRWVRVTIKVPIWRALITSSVLTKFARLKVNVGEYTVRRFDATHNCIIYGRLTSFSSKPEEKRGKTKGLNTSPTMIK